MDSVKYLSFVLERSARCVDAFGRQRQDIKRSVELIDRRLPAVDRLICKLKEKKITLNKQIQELEDSIYLAEVTIEDSGHTYLMFKLQQANASSHGLKQTSASNFQFLQQTRALLGYLRETLAKLLSTDEEPDRKPAKIMSNNTESLLEESKKCLDELKRKRKVLMSTMKSVEEEVNKTSQQICSLMEERNALYIERDERVDTLLFLNHSATHASIALEKMLQSTGILLDAMEGDRDEVRAMLREQAGKDYKKIIRESGTGSQEVAESSGEKELATERGEEEKGGETSGETEKTSEGGGGSQRGEASGEKQKKGRKASEHFQEEKGKPRMLSKLGGLSLEPMTPIEEERRQVSP